MTYHAPQPRNPEHVDRSVLAAEEQAIHTLAEIAHGLGLNAFVAVREHGRGWKTTRTLMPAGYWHERREPGHEGWTRQVITSFLLANGRHVHAILTGDRHDDGRVEYRPTALRITVDGDERPVPISHEECLALLVEEGARAVAAHR